MEHSPEIPSDAAAPRFTHDGRTGELFTITLVNLLLKLLTLGSYHFWGKARVRRYVWSHTRFAGERFEYTGTGLELARGFALGLVLVLPLAAAWGLPQLAPPEVLLPYWPLLFLLSPLAYGYLLFLIGLARYSARRYLLGHTRWRGIRFALTGSAGSHGWKMLFYSILLGLTFSLYTPYMRSNLTHHFLNHTWFGDRRFRYDGQGSGLRGRYWGFLALAFLAGAVASLVVAPLLAGLVAWLQRVVGSGGLAGQALLVGLSLAGYLPWAMMWLWYRAGELRYFFAHTMFGPVRFRAEFGTAAFIWLRVGNAVAVTLTLGLAYPWAVVRTARFLSAHVRLVGELDYAAIGQSPEEVLRSGEGLAEALGLSAI